jgi:dipeptidyl aminopeptidase/acylaminoacyl peptidase
MKKTLLLPQIAAVSLLLACTHIGGPGLDGVRTPLWVQGGQAIVHSQRHRANTADSFDLWLDDTQGRPERRLLRRIDPGAMSERALRGDGRRLAVLAGKGAIKNIILVDLQTGRRRTLTRGMAIRPETISWEPNGQRLAFSLANEPSVGFVDTASWRFSRQPLETPIVCDWLRGSDGRLLLASANSAAHENTLVAWQAGTANAPTVVFRTAQGEIHAARSDPSGQWVAVIVNPPPTPNAARSNLVLLHLPTGWQRVVWESPRPLVGIVWAPDNQSVFVSQLGREDASGWTLYRIGLTDFHPVALFDHRAGWDISPDGRRAVLSRGQALAVIDLPAAP